MSSQYEHLHTPNDKLIDLCEQFEALPLSDEFDELMDKFCIEKKVSYRCKEAVHLTRGAVSEALSDTFFFPYSSTLSDIKMQTIATPEGDWVYSGEFSIGEHCYKLTATQDVCTLSGHDVDGNTLTTFTDHTKILSLLIHIIAQEKSIDPAPILDRITDLTPQEGYSNMLNILGNIKGSVSTSRTAELPLEYADRALIITHSEEDSPNINGVRSQLMLNWEIFNTNTETTATMNEIRNGGEQYTGLSVRYADRKNTTVPIDEYLISKQLAELYPEDEYSESHLISSRDDPMGWIHTSAIFMSTIGPFLDELRIQKATEEPL